MWPESPLFPESASTVSDEVDALYTFLWGVSGFFMVLIATLVIVFAVKFRRRGHPEVQQITHASGPRFLGKSVLFWMEIGWSLLPLLVGLVMFAWGAKLYVRVQTPPADASEIYVVAKQWMWKLYHPGGRGEINTLHMPVGRPVKLVMVSEDVIHSFYVPAFRVKQDVLPGRYTTLWFQPTKPGSYHLFCAEYCGTDHSRMVGTVEVLTEAAYQEWLAGKLETQTLATRGEILFQRLRCDSCHRGQTARGPSLAGRFGQPVQLASGETVAFDEQHIRRAILDPGTEITAGFQPLMPTYRKKLNEAEMLALIGYLKSLAAARQ